MRRQLLRYRLLKASRINNALNRNVYDCIYDSENVFHDKLGCQTKKEYLKYHGLSQDGKGRFYCDWVNGSHAIKATIIGGRFTSNYIEDVMRPMHIRSFMIRQHNFMYNKYLEGVIK